MKAVTVLRSCYCVLDYIYGSRYEDFCIERYLIRVYSKGTRYAVVLVLVQYSCLSCAGITLTESGVAEKETISITEPYCSTYQN